MGMTLRSYNGRRGCEEISVTFFSERAISMMRSLLPSTARLNSTARVLSTRTYSRRKFPSSSVSPGI